MNKFSTQNRKRRLDVESLETRLVLTANVSFSDWHNESNGADVNADGHVAPIDALHIINTLTEVSGGSIDSIQQTWFDKDPDASELFGNFLPDSDGDGDGVVSPLDALLTINRLTDQTNDGEISSTVSVIPDPQGRPMRVEYTAADGLSSRVDLRNDDVVVRWSGNDVFITETDDTPRAIAKPGVGFLYTERVRRDATWDIQATVIRDLTNGARVVERYVCMPIMISDGMGGWETRPFMPLDPRQPIDGFEEAMGAIVERTTTNDDGSIIQETYVEASTEVLTSVTVTLPTGVSATVSGSVLLWPTNIAADLLFLLRQGIRFESEITMQELITAVEENGGTPQSFDFFPNVSEFEPEDPLDTP